MPSCLFIYKQAGFVQNISLFSKNAMDYPRQKLHTLLTTYNFWIENKYPAPLPYPLLPIAPLKVLTVKSNRKLKKKNQERSWTYSSQTLWKKVENIINVCPVRCHSNLQPAFAQWMHELATAKTLDSLTIWMQNVSMLWVLKADQSFFFFYVYVLLQQCQRFKLPCKQRQL